MKKDYQLVYIVWKDPVSYTNGWAEIEEFTKQEPAICRSVGWITREDRAKNGNITIVPHFTTNAKGVADAGGGDVTLPKSLIIKRVELEID